MFQIGLFRAIEPEAIKARDGDVGINVNVTYSISAGTNFSRRLSLTF